MHESRKLGRQVGWGGEMWFQRHKVGRRSMCELHMSDTGVWGGIVCYMSRIQGSKGMLGSQHHEECRELKWTASLTGVRP